MKAIILITLFAFTASFKKPYVNKFDTKLNLTPYDFSSSLITNTLSARFVQTSTKNVLTGEGIMHSWILGNSIWLGFGYQGWTYMVSYFILGSLVTKLKFDEKKEKGIEEKRSGARGPENVWGSGATATLFSILSIFLGSNTFYNIGFVSSVATKLSDTFASEVGKAYGKNCYLITTFEKVEPGTEGAVSIEGTIAGIIGSILLALISVELNLINFNDIPNVMISAFIATTIESLLGATIQDKNPILTNEFINFLNTLIGALVSISIYFLYK